MESGDDSQKSRIDKYLTQLKSHPLVAILVVIGLSVIGLAQFTDALQKLAVFWPDEKLPDLIICDVDMANSRVDICNQGNKSAPTEGLYFAWSEGWYTKPEWNNDILLGALQYVANQEIPAGKKLRVRIEGLSKVDSGTEFMIDASEAVKESDERNNCVAIGGKVISCRFSGIKSEKDGK